MSMFEGIGDEVIWCVCTVLFILCLYLAWTSTWVQYPQLLIIDARNTVSSDGIITTDVTQRTEEISSSEIQTDTSSNSNTNKNETQLESERNEGATAAEQHHSVESELIEPLGPAEQEKSPVSHERESRTSRQEKESTSTHEEVQAPANNQAKEELRQKRLKHFESSNREDLTVNQENVASHTSNQENTPEETPPVQPSPRNTGDIQVKLKYLNDTLRLVDGKLDEKLGDFKQRHFAFELSRNKLVKLIFNGQLLRSDGKTLRKYGLFDECVVHCHVAQAPATSTPPTPDVMQDELDLDLGHLMMPLFCIILAIVWYCWVEFGQLFNATATIALVGVTGLIVVSLMALYGPVPGDRLVNINFARRN